MNGDYVISPTPNAPKDQVTISVSGEGREDSHRSRLTLCFLAHRMSADVQHEVE